MSSYEKHFNKGYLIIITAAIIYLIFLLLSNSQILITTVEKVRWGFLVLIFVSEFTVLIFRTIRNRIFLKSIDINISFSRIFLIYFAGLSMSVTPANIGELIRTQFLKREVGRSIASTAPIYFGERINDLIAITAITCFFLIFVNFLEGEIVVAISALIILFGIAILKSHLLFRFFKSKIKSIKFLEKHTENFDQFYNNMQNMLKIDVTKKTIPASFPIWLTHGISAYLAFLAFGVNFGFMKVYVIYFTSLIIGASSFIPGGIGITETSLLGLLTIQGINFSIAVALTLFLRLLTIWFAVIVGIVASKILLHKDPPTRSD